MRWAIVGGLAIALVGLSTAPAFAGPGGCSGGGSGTTCISVTANSSAPVARGGTANLAFSLSVTGGTAAHATFLAHLDPDLTLEPGSVQVGGSTPTAGVTTPPGEVSIDLVAAGANLGSGSTVDVSFSATVSQSATADLTTSASVTYDDGTHPSATSNSASEVVPLKHPDFSISDVSGAKLLPGATTNAVVHIENPGAPAAAELALTFPSGLRSDGVKSSAGSALSCATAGRTTTCALPAGDRGLFDIGVAAASNATPGVTAGISATVTPIGITDANPANNSVVIPATIIPHTTLTFGVYPPNASSARPSPVFVNVPAHIQQHVRLSVTNKGPANVPDLELRLAAQSTALSDWHVRLSPHGAQFTFAIVHVGSLPVGHTYEVNLYVTAAARDVKVLITMLGESSDVYLIQPSFDRAGDSGAALNLTSVRQTTSIVPRPAAPASTATAPLANTGTQTEGAVGVGLAALVAGIMLCLAGRGRRRA